MSEGPTLKERRMRVPELAQEMGISQRAIYNAVARGTLPHYRFGRTIYVTERHAIEFLRNCEQRIEESGR